MQSLMTIVGNMPGSLPIKTTFQSPLDGPATMAFSGTAWSQTQNTMIGIQVQLDGNVIGTAQIFSNSAAEHKTLPAQLMNVDLTVGPHTILIVPLNANTVTDSNDNFSVWLLI